MTEEERGILKGRLQGEKKWERFLSAFKKLHAVEGLAYEAAWDQLALDKRFRDKAAQQEEEVLGVAGVVAPAGDGAAVIARTKKDLKAQKLDVGVVIQWVFEHLDDGKASKMTEPHPGAYAFLEHVRSSLEVRAWFFQSMFAKLMPTRTQLDVTDRFKDDGRNVLDVLDRIESMERASDG